MGLAMLHRALGAAMPLSTQSPSGTTLGDVDTDDRTKCLSVLVTVKPGESPGRGTYRKGVTRSTHVGC